MKNEHVKIIGPENATRLTCMSLTKINKECKNINQPHYKSKGRCCLLFAPSNKQEVAWGYTK